MIKVHRPVCLFLCTLQIRSGLKYTVAKKKKRLFGRNKKPTPDPPVMPPMGKGQITTISTNIGLSSYETYMFM